MAKRKDDEAITELSGKFKEYFEVKNLGQAQYHSGIQIQLEEDWGFLLNQTKKIKAILKQHGMHERKGCSTTMILDYLKQKEEYDLLPDNSLCRQALGALVYLTTTTRPDIAAAVGFVCTRVSKPRKEDWSAVKKEIRYWKETKDQNLKISADGELNLISYAAADWAGDLTDRRTTCRCLFFLGGNDVSHQAGSRLLLLSSTQTEYEPAANANQEAIWVQKLLDDFGERTILPISVYIEN